MCVRLEFCPIFHFIDPQLRRRRQPHRSCKEFARLRSSDSKIARHSAETERRTAERGPKQSIPNSRLSFALDAQFHSNANAFSVSYLHSHGGIGHQSVNLAADRRAERISRLSDGKIINWNVRDTLNNI